MADTQGMARTSTRSLWKGAITFGLVHIPVGLYSATEETEVDFDWLDKRTLDPVGYKRINKRTGREIDKDHIVKGVRYEKGHYVVLSPEEVEQAYPRSTQTIEILSFVDVDDVPFVYLERPYYTAPVNQSAEKVYALLREALRGSRKAGIARVVIHTKQHLALLVPCGPVLVLNMLRWGGEIRSWQGLPLPAEGKAAGIRDSEMKMAQQLIADMSGHWSATEYRDSFREAIMKFVERKARAGETATVEALEEAPERRGAEVIDLTELLRRSLKGGAPAPAARKAGAAAPNPAAKRERAVAAAPARSRAAKKDAAAKRGAHGSSKTPRARRAA